MVTPIPLLSVVILVAAVTFAERDIAPRANVSRVPAFPIDVAHTTPLLGPGARYQLQLVAT